MVQIVASVTATVVAAGVIATLSWCASLLREQANRKKGVLTWRGVTKGSKVLIKRINESDFAPDVIVGIGRGGAVIGTILSANLDPNRVIPLIVIDRQYPCKGSTTPVVHCDLRELTGKRVLLVFGEVYTGSTLQVLYEAVSQHSPSDTRIASLLKVKPIGVSAPVRSIDFYAFAATPSGRTKLPWRFPGAYDDYVRPPT